MDLNSFLFKYHKVFLYLVTIGLVVYGVMAIANPDVLSGGFDQFTEQDWGQFMADNHPVAGYVTLLWRLIGSFNLTAGLTLTLIVWKWLNRKESWAWTTLLVGTTIAYLSPMSLDLSVMSISIFEVLEFFFFAMFLAIMLLVRKHYFIIQGMRGSKPGEIN